MALLNSVELTVFVKESLVVRCTLSRSISPRLILHGGLPRGFDLSSLSHFALQIHQALLLIPFGQTRCYSELGPARAVGQACHRNRFPYLVPCHRVVGKGGNLGGYAFGSDIKSLLLAEESSCQARKQQTISEPEPFFSFLAEQKELRALLEQPLQSVLLQKE